MASTSPIYLCNGKYVAADRASVPVHDLGLVRGFGLFEAVRTYDGKPFLFDAHLRRLFGAMKTVGISLPFSRAEFAEKILRLVKKNGPGEALIRIVITGGPAPSLLPQGNPSWIVMVDPLHPFPSWQYEKGIALMTAPFSRIFPSIKTTCYIGAVQETVRAVRRGFAEAVYVDRRGAILEGTTYSVFAVLPGPRLVTPEAGVLPGITAECVIKLAQKPGISVQRTPISTTMLRRADEMFITSSNRELIPVIRVDRLRIANGKPGPVTRRLHIEYQKLM